MKTVISLRNNCSLLSFENIELLRIIILDMSFFGFWYKIKWKTSCSYINNISKCKFMLISDQNFLCKHFWCIFPNLENKALIVLKYFIKENEDIHFHLPYHRYGSSHRSKDISIQRKLQRAYETCWSTAITIRKEGDESQYEQFVFWKAGRR